MRAAASRAAILRAAEFCFIREGYPVSIEVIREEAGVSRATLFSHFGSKEALYREVVTNVSDRELTPLFSMLDKPADYVDALRQFALTFTRGVLKPDRVGFHRLCVTEANRFPELASSHYVSGMGLVLPAVARYLAKGMKAGIVRKEDPKLMAEQFLASSMGYRQYRALLTREEDAPSSAKYVEAALRAILVAAPKPPRKTKA